MVLLQGAYCRNMYVHRICSHITLLVYFFGAPHILFSSPVIKICVAKLRDALDNTGQMHLHYSEAQTSIDFSVNTQQS